MDLVTFIIDPANYTNALCGRLQTFSTTSCYSTVRLNKLVCRLTSDQRDGESLVFLSLYLFSASGTMSLASLLVSDRESKEHLPLFFWYYILYNSALEAVSTVIPLADLTAIH